MKVYSITLSSIKKKEKKKDHQLSFVNSDTTTFLMTASTLTSFFLLFLSLLDFPTDGRAEDKAKDSTGDKGRKMPHDSTREAYLICQDQSMTKAV